MGTMAEDHIESAFVIGCSRCANEGLVYTLTTADDAEAEFRGWGWTKVGHRAFCPQCSAGS